MNTKNALGFVVLGLAFYSIPTFVQAYTADGSWHELQASVRMLWLSFMGSLITSIGIAYLTKEGVVHFPEMMASVKAEAWYRYLFARTTPSAATPLAEAAARAVVSN